MIAIGEVEFELNSPMDLALREELIRNAATILTTLRGTNPTHRAMGLIPGEIIGKNAIYAKGTYSVQAIEQIEMYEPRLSVDGISFLVRDHKLIPKVVLTYNGD